MTWEGAGGAGGPGYEAAKTIHVMIDHCTYICNVLQCTKMYIVSNIVPFVQYFVRNNSIKIVAIVDCTVLYNVLHCTTLQQL